jgi:DNA-binding CsgD family transcriptional regulator
MALTKVESIVREIYEASVNHGAWERVLVQVADLINATGGYLLIVDQIKRCPIFSVVGRLPKENGRQQCTTYYHQLDANLHQLRDIPTNQWVFDQFYFHEGNIPANKLAADLLLRYGRCWTAANRLAELDGLEVLIGFQRGTAQPGFGPLEAAALQGLSEHLRLAAHLMLKTLPHTQKVHSGFGILDQISHAVIVTDCESRIYFANRVAGSFFRMADGLVTRNHKLLSLINDKALAAQIRAAVTEGKIGALSIPRPSKRPPYNLIISPLISTTLPISMHQRASALIQIANPDHQPILMTDLLASLYKLTPAKTRLTLRLFDGVTPAEYAEEAQISIATVRTQIRSVLDKTHTRRQAELIKLLALLPTVKGTSWAVPV